MTVLKATESTLTTPQLSLLELFSYELLYAYQENFVAFIRSTIMGRLDNVKILMERGSDVESSDKVE